MKHVEKTIAEKFDRAVGKNGWQLIVAATMMLPGTMAVPGCRKHTEQSASGRIDSSLY